METIKDLFYIDYPLEIRVASNLEPLVLTESNAPLIKEIGILRNCLATNLGFLLPPVKFHDSKSLKENEYSIFINGVEIDSSKVYSDCYSVTQYHWIESFQEQPDEYISAVIPCSNSEKLYWVKKEIIDGLVKENKWTKPCVQDVQFAAYHLSEVVLNNIEDLFTQAQFRKILQEVAGSNQDLYTFFDSWVEFGNPNIGKFCEKSFIRITKTVLCNLLRERISIRNIICILELIQKHFSISPDKGLRETDLISEKVRMSLRKQISQQLANSNKEIQYIALSSEIESELENSLQRIEDEFILVPVLESVQKATAKITKSLNNVHAKLGFYPIILVNPGIRLPLFRLLSRSYNHHVKVFSYAEIINNIPIKLLETIC